MKKIEIHNPTEKVERIQLYKAYSWIKIKPKTSQVLEIEDNDPSEINHYKEVSELHGLKLISHGDAKEKVETFQKEEPTPEDEDKDESPEDPNEEEEVEESPEDDSSVEDEEELDEESEEQIKEHALRKKLEELEIDEINQLVDKANITTHGATKKSTLIEKIIDEKEKLDEIK